MDRSFTPRPPHRIPRTVLVGRDKRTPLYAVCARYAQRARLGSPGGPDVRQALERPPMPAHACCGHPVKVGARTSQEPCGVGRRGPARHVRVPAPRVDQLVQLPGLIRPRPRLERLLDRRTLPGGQCPGSLLLPRPIGGLLGRRGGRVGPHRHPVPAPPGGFPFHTRGIEAWPSHGIAPHSDPNVTFWDVISCRGC